MAKIEQIQEIAIETTKLEQLQNEAEQAESGADSAIERDLHRTDGSERQDRLHEQILQNIIDRSHEARAAYDRQEKLVKDLVEQL